MLPKKIISQAVIGWPKSCVFSFFYVDVRIILYIENNISLIICYYFLLKEALPLKVCYHFFNYKFNDIIIRLGYIKIGDRQSLCISSTYRGSPRKSPKGNFFLLGSFVLKLYLNDKLKISCYSIIITSKSVFLWIAEVVSVRHFVIY